VPADPGAVILAPTDMSEPSSRAVAYAAELARRMETQLVLLHILSPRLVDERAEKGNFVDVQLEDERTTLDQWYTGVVNEVIRKGVRADFRIAVGDPVEEILDLAQFLHAEMIVMGTHGRTGLQRALLGSVAEGVLRHAECPVLTLRMTG
jgi:nucleotide-binding universal stress UspA family protein